MFFCFSYVLCICLNMLLKGVLLKLDPSQNITKAVLNCMLVFHYVIK